MLTLKKEVGCTLALSVWIQKAAVGNLRKSGMKMKMKGNKEQV